MRGVIRNDASNPIGLSPTDYATYQLFETSDLVFKLIDLENVRTSRVGIVPEPGAMSSAYVRLTALGDGVPQYWFYAFYDLYLRRVFNALGGGVRQTLPPKALMNLIMQVPPTDEQAVIVRYLDLAELRIHEAIQAKLALSALLAEEKKIAVQGAILRGLDDSVLLRPGPFPLLHEVPANWEIRPAKYLFKDVDERSKTGEEELLSVSHLTGETPRSGKKMSPATSHRGSDQPPRPW